MSQFKNLFSAPIAIAIFSLFVNSSFAQIGGGGDLGGGDFGGGDLAGGIIDAVEAGGGVGGGGTTGNVSGGNTTDGGSTGGLGNLSEIFNMDVEVTPDERNTRGFVGVSLMDPDSVFPEFRFVGPRSMAEPGTTNAGNPAGNRVGNANPLGGPNTGTGMEIQRRTPIRTRIVPRFQAPSIAPNFVAARVSQRLASLPATRQFSNSMNVSMQGRTAIITGTARNQQEVSRISRQLRFEPGVSRVVNRVVVNGQ